MNKTEWMIKFGFGACVGAVLACVAMNGLDAAKAQLSESELTVEPEVNELDYPTQSTDSTITLEGDTSLVKPIHAPNHGFWHTPQCSPKERSRPNPSTTLRDDGKLEVMLPGPIKEIYAVEDGEIVLEEKLKGQWRPGEWEFKE